MTWRVFAVRLNGDGTETGLHPELPATACPITDALSAPGQLTVTLEPESVDPALFVQWSTAIYAERDGVILGAGIVSDVNAEGPKLLVTCTGWADYLTGMPWVDSPQSYVSTDPGRILAKVWQAVQAKPFGNIGLEVPTVATGRTVGTPKVGKTAAQPFVLAQYETADLGATQTTLLGEGAMEYIERHWWAGSTIRHALVLASPRVGRRRSDLRLVIGENVQAVPSVSDAEYASEVLILGAGEGPKKVMARAINAAPGRLRRVFVGNYSTVTRTEQATTLAGQLLRLLTGTADDLEQVVVIDSPAAPLASLTPGDEVLVSGPAGAAGDVSVWLRILGRTYDPVAAPDQVTLDVARADKVGG